MISCSLTLSLSGALSLSSARRLLGQKEGKQRLVAQGPRVWVATSSAHVSTALRPQLVDRRGEEERYACGSRGAIAGTDVAIVDRWLPHYSPKSLPWLTPHRHCTRANI
jgi:hypothetical protein